MPDPISSTPEQARNTSKKRQMGLILIVCGVIAPWGGVEASAFTGMFTLAGILEGVVGLFLFGTANGRSGWWSLLGLVPFGGPILGIITLAVAEVLEHGLLKISAPPIARNLCIVIVGLTPVGVIAFIAISNFLAVQNRSRQAEARTNLGGIFVAETEFYKEHGRYGNLDEIGFRLDGQNNRYTYRIDASGRPGTMISASIGQAMPDNTIVSAGISPDGQAFTATATAQLDTDDTIDQWHVNDLKLDLQTADVSDVTNVTNRETPQIGQNYQAPDKCLDQGVDQCLEQGKVYADKGWYRQAIEKYEATLRLKPDSALAYARMGYAYRELGRHDDAVQALKQAISLGRGDYRDYSNLGIAYDHLGRYEDAIEAHRQAVRLKPDEAVVHNNAGATLVNAKRYEEAIVELKEAIRLAPDSDMSHYNLSRAYYLSGNREQARKHYEILKDLNPSKAEALLKETPM